MKTSLFDFHLPDELIATEPAQPRDSARMLTVSADGTIADAMVRDLPGHLRPGDVMVFNDTRVMPARLWGMRGEARIEVLLHQAVTLASGDTCWRCFAKPARKLREGDRLDFAEDFFAMVGPRSDDGQVVLCFNATQATLRDKLAQYGEIPLPPYIEKQRKALATDQRQQWDDTQHYQTVYAGAYAASVAAPTAGLHFTPELLAAIDAAGVARVHVTLHVGGGTFLPVKAEDTHEHVMHSEYAEISAEAAARINAAKAAGGRVIAVGTTSLRTLESAADEHGVVQPMARDTNLFITPGYRFKIVDGLMTNFHLPRSTLFMLVSAFSGLETMQKAYAHAVAQRYRFYSYGDACLIAPATPAPVM